MSLLHDVDASKFPLSRVAGTEDEQRLSAWALNVFESMRSYWAPRHEAGDKIIKAIQGEFFSQQAKNEMRAQRKVPIQIAEGWPKFSAMVGVAVLSMKSGGLISQGPEDTPDEETMEIISRVVDNEAGMQTLRSFAVRDAYASGCPQFIMLDRARRSLDGKTLSGNLIPWRMGFLDPLCRDTEKLSDCRYIGFQHLVSKDYLLRKYPNRRQAVEDAFRGVSGIGEVAATGLSASERATVFTAVQSGRNEAGSLGRMTMVEILSLVTQRVTVWDSPNSEKPVSLEGMDPAKVEEWKAANPEWVPVELDVDILWVTAVLSTGQVIENAPHWFQEGKFPGACLVLQWLNDVPVSPLQFAVDNWLLQAIAKTEHTHSIRLSTDGLTLVQEGAIKNEADLTNELTRPGGRVVVKRGVPFNNALLRVPNQREQMAWADVFGEAQLANDRLTVDRNIEGGAQSSQEAAKVVQLRVSQMQNKTAQAQSAIDAFAREIEDIKIRMICRTVTSEQAFRYIDESNGVRSVKEVVANKADQVDFMGDPLRVVNRLDKAKYDVVAIATDNSPTGREAELNAFVLIMQQILPNVPPDYWPSVLGQIPNTICQRIAAEVKKQAEAMAAQPKTPDAKLTGTLDLSKIAFDPMVRAAAEKAGFLDPVGPAPGAPETMQPPSGSAPGDTQGAIA